MLETCNESCNDLDGRVCVLNKTKIGSLNLFNMTIRINETKKLKKHISCDCKCKFDGKVVYKDIAISVVVNAKIQYDIVNAKNIVFGILAFARLLNILKTMLTKSLINNSVITYDEILDRP